MKITLFESLSAAKEAVPVNEMRIIKVDGKKFILANIDNSFHAFEKNCPHMGHPLIEGTINPFGEIVCALHTYRFDLKLGTEANNRCRDLKVYPVLIEDNEVKVEI